MSAVGFDFEILFNLKHQQKEVLRKISLMELKKLVEEHSEYSKCKEIECEDALQLYDLFNLKAIDDLGHLKAIQFELSGFLRG